MTATFHVGDAIEVMGKLPEKSVDLILTSPPFLALRSYLPADHPDKALEGGSQATPGIYIDWLVDVVEACDRVLAPHGSMCIELGDTYAGSAPAGNMTVGEDQLVHREDHARAMARRFKGYGQDKMGPGWPLAKSLSLIPELFRLTLVYGTNPLTGRQTERWRLRNVVRWVRPNPPVGALGDKFRPATSELMVFCKSAKRYFDLDAVRTTLKEPSAATPEGAKRVSENMASNPSRGDYGQNVGKFIQSNPAGAPPLDWWSIPLSDDEEPVIYGVSMAEQRKALAEMRRPRKGAKSKIEGSFGSNAPDNPAGAPPLDWWNIPLEERDPSSLLEGSESGTTTRGRDARDSYPLDASYWNVPLLEGEEPTKYGKTERQRKDGERSGTGPKTLNASEDGTGWAWERTLIQNPLGAPPLDWWNIPPGGYAGSHYAVFPAELCIKPIKAMSPERVCKTCGEPSRRIVENTYEAQGPVWKQHLEPAAQRHGSESSRAQGMALGRATKTVTTLGFSDCGHDDWRPGLVLDPFGGSGTTALVATGHGRDCILIDLDPRNFDLALDRVGPFILTLGSLP